MPAAKKKTNGHFLSQEERDLLRRTRCKELNDDEFAEFMHAVDRHKLDPFSNQIHAVLRKFKRDGVWVRALTVQTGIDGYRLIADRTGKYAGNDDAVCDYAENDKLDTACVVVHKMTGEQRCPYSATARWSEYYPGGKQGYMWEKMPHVMLSKCAEALALRKAFPAELSGLYTDAEMHQADTPVPNSEQGQAAKKPAPAEPQESPEPSDRGKVAAEASKALSEAKKALEKQFETWIRSEGVQDDARPILLKIIAQELGRIVNVTLEDVTKVREAILAKKYTPTGELVPAPELGEEQPALLPQEG